MQRMYNNMNALNHKPNDRVGSHKLCEIEVEDLKGLYILSFHLLPLTIQQEMRPCILITGYSNGAYLLPLVRAARDGRKIKASIVFQSCSQRSRPATSHQIFALYSLLQGMDTCMVGI